MIRKLFEIADHRELLQTFVVKELIARYQASAVGYIWVLLNPFLMMILFTLVYSVFLRIQVENYALFFISAMLPWNYFINCLSQGTSSLAGNTHFINKFYCPREMFSIKVVLSHTFVLLNSFVALIPLILYFKGTLSWTLLLLPAVIFIHILFTTGLVFLLCILHVFYRDITHLLEFALVFWYFLTPVFYPVSMVPEEYQHWFNWNPMHIIISLYRDILYQGTPPSWSNFGTATAISLGTLIVGWHVFSHYEGRAIKEL